MTHRLRRVTADIDSKNIFNIVFRLYRAIKLNPEIISLEPSTSKGWHLVVWTRAYGKMTELRAYIGDDPKRLFMDTTHRYGKQTLFSKKKKL